MFPFSPTVSTRFFLISTSSEISPSLIVSSCLNHLSDLFVAGKHFACVSKCNSIFPSHYVASGTVPGVAVLSHCFDTSLLLDLLSVMVLLTCALVQHHILYPIQFCLSLALLLIERIQRRMIIFSAMSSRRQMYHLLLGHGRRTRIFSKLRFSLAWNKPPAFL